MTLYCYATEDGDTVELRFPMGHAPDTVKLDDGRVAKRDVLAEHRGTVRRSNAAWPMKSTGSGVHPDQIEEAEAFNRSRGIDTKYDRATGEAIFKSPLHRRKHLKVWEQHDRSGYD